MKAVIILLVLTILISLFIALYLPGYSRYHELEIKEEQLVQEIGKYQTMNDQLMREIDLLKNDVTHLESVMRNEMGLVKPGEVIYKVVEEEMPAPTQDQTATQQVREHEKQSAPQ